MDLKKFLLKKEDADKKEYLWSLIIEPGWVQAGIWRIEGEKAQVVLYCPPFSWEVEEDLVTAADNALSSAIQGFPDSVAEPQKTVFGIVSSWVSEGRIKTEYLSKIKNVCSELSLTPIGFVVLPEAIAHLIKSEEGSPLNAILVGVYGQHLEVTLFSLGNLLGTTEVSRSVSVVDDVTEGMTRFGVKDFIPSRILLYNGRVGELEEVRQSLLQVNWEDDARLRFLHTPKVEIVEVKEKIFAVSLAGASEMASVKSVESLKTPSAEPMAGSDLVRTTSDIVGSEEEEIRTSTEKPFVHARELPRPPISPYEVESDQDKEKPTPEELGFALERDVREQEGMRQLERLEKEERSEAFHEDKIHENLAPISSRDLAVKSSPRSGFNFLWLTLLFSKIKGMLTNLRLPKTKLPQGFMQDGNRLLITGLGFFATFLIIGGILWWSLPKATVTIYVLPQKLEEEFDMSVDASKSSSDFSGKILAGEILDVEVSGDKTKSTTGTKTVGDKAKGEVTLYRVGSQLTLPVGTLLHGPENLQFALEDEVVVASGSAGSAGSVKAKVTASDIGAQYNLATGTVFRVGNYGATDLEAKNETSFTGGSSREITAVSAEDQVSLEEDLGEELRNNAKAKILEKVSQDKLLIDESLVATTSSRTFSGKVGDEADTLKLSLGLKANAVSIKKEEVVTLANEVLKNKVPEGFILRGDQIDFDFNSETKDTEVYKFEVRVSANLLPKVDSEEIITKIRGRNPEIAREYLERGVAGFVRAEIKLRPELPAKLKTLPHVVKNIEIEIAAER